MNPASTRIHYRREICEEVRCNRFNQHLTRYGWDGILLSEV